MNDEFKEEIRKIAVEAEHGNEALGRKLPESAGDAEFLKAIEEFFSAAREAVDIYNEASGSPVLALHRLPPEFLDLFLDIPDRRGGFSILSPRKIVILFDEDPDLVTVIGKKRKGDGSTGSALSSAIQLIKVSFKTGKDGISYRDNSGGAVNPRGLVALFIRWATSA